MANRVQDAIEKLRANPGLESVPESAFTIGPDEHRVYQDLQSTAFAGQHLTMDEAWLVHTALGKVFTEGNDGWAEGTDKATKITVIRLISELVGVAS